MRRRAGMGLLAVGWFVCGGCLSWRPPWPTPPEPAEPADSAPATVSALLERARQLEDQADTEAGVEAALAGYGSVLAADPSSAPAHLALAHLNLLAGDAYAVGARAKRDCFQRAMTHAAAVMYTNPAFRDRIGAGDPLWVAVGALGEGDMEAMLHWVNGVFYLFKEAQSPLGQVLNFRWIGRARLVMERMSEVAPDWGDGAVHFVWGLYYLSLPERVGGDHRRAAAYLARAIDVGPESTLPRWGRGKYFHVRMGDPEGFVEDLEWVAARDPRSQPGAYAWNVFFHRDARRLLAARDRLFPHGGGKGAP